MYLHGCCSLVPASVSKAKLVANGELSKHISPFIDGLIVLSD